MPFFSLFSSLLNNYGEHAIPLFKETFEFGIELISPADCEELMWRTYLYTANRMLPRTNGICGCMQSSDLREINRATRTSNFQVALPWSHLSRDVGTYFRAPHHFTPEPAAGRCLEALARYPAPGQPVRFGTKLPVTNHAQCVAPSLRTSLLSPVRCAKL